MNAPHRLSEIPSEKFILDLIFIIYSFEVQTEYYSHKITWKAKTHRKTNKQTEQHYQPGVTGRYQWKRTHPKTSVVVVSQFHFMLVIRKYL